MRRYAPIGAQSELVVLGEALRRKSASCAPRNLPHANIDGTLTDPRQGIVRCIQHALARLGKPVPAEAELLWAIGPPLLDSFRKLVGNEGEAATALGYYRERFSEVGLYENAAYAGVAESLAELRAGGRSMYVATSKPHVYASRILEHFALDGWFDGLFGAELSGERSDKTELLAHALRTTGVDAATAVMVGDRSHDVVGACNNGITAVGVAYGYGSVDELAGAGAAMIVNDAPSLRDIPARLELCRDD